MRGWGLGTRPSHLSACCLYDLQTFIVTQVANTVVRRTGYKTTTSQTATQLQPMLSFCGSTITLLTGAFHHCLYILSNVNTTSATPLLNNSTVLLTIKRHYSVTITRTNQVGEYNSMHVSLGFMVHNNHPPPQGWVYF